MDFRYLPGFLMLAETGSFTGAARALKIAQSAVSRQIQLLEESLETQLVIRSPKRVLLTPAGQALHRQLKSFSDWGIDFFKQGAVELRIGTVEGVLDHWLSSKLAGMKPDHVPNITIDVMTDEQIVEAFNAGRIDMGFSAAKIETDIVSSRLLFKEEYVLISREDVDLKRLHEYKWISGKSARYLNRLSKKTPERWVKVNSLAAIIRLVSEGHGIAVLPGHLVPSGLRLKVYRDLGLPAGAAYLCLPAYETVPPLLRQFVADLR